jgi:glycosyltransferase involved in cell wall biosynthesis
MAIKNELLKLLFHIKSVFHTASLNNPGTRSKITANIICKNNITSIASCLQSLVNVVDEIVIIDTGSTDGTVEFIEVFLNERFDKTKQSYTLVKENYFQSYSYHRNQAILLSKGDWILVIDSDEYLSSSLQKILKQLVSTKIYSAYRFYRRWIKTINAKSAEYIFTKRFKGRYKSITRLFRNLPEIKYQGELHEAVFGLEGKRVKTINENIATLYHLDTAINSYQTRLEKVQSRETILAGSGHPEEYLPELFNIPVKKVPDEDYNYCCSSLSTISGNINQNTI